MTRQNTTWLLLTAALLTGCTAAPAASAPASSPPASTPASAAPAQLTLAFTGGFAEAQISLFERELLAAGAIDLTISGDFDTDVLGVEQQIIAAVAAGDLDLGWIGARAFSELGVTAFDPLIAPFAIDSLVTQRAVLASDLPDRMLAAVTPLGVEGLAIMAGPLRRPIAAEAPLTSVEDFAGTSFYTFHGAVPAATLTALGAENVDADPPVRDARIEDGSIDAYENTLISLYETADRRANIMTANVNLWPAIGVLIANPDTLAQLTEDQAVALRAAVAATAGQAFDALPDEAELAAQACAAGGRFALASEAELAALSLAVRPVLADIASREDDAAALDKIVDLRADTPPDSVEIPEGCSAGPATGQ